jgi:hypothetical protein
MRVLVLPLILALAFIWIVAFLGGIIGTLVFRPMLNRTLRERHPSIWAILGAPALSASLTGGDSGSVWKWVWHRRYLELNDPITARVANAYRLAGVALFASAILAIAFALLGKFL